MKDKPFAGSNRAKILELYEAGHSPAEIARIMHAQTQGRRPDNAAVAATLDRYRPGWRLERKQKES